MSTTQYAIPGGDAGTIATMRMMAAQAYRAASLVSVRDLAASLVRGTGRNGMEHAAIISQWILTHTEFLADPTHAEAINTVSRSLDLIARNGVAQIDCDDVATLAASLALSIGLKVRFVAAAFGSDPRAPYAHVWADIGPGWLTIDPPRSTVELPPVARLLVMEL